MNEKNRANTYFPLPADRTGSSVHPVTFFAFVGIDLKSNPDENSSDNAFSCKSYSGVVGLSLLIVFDVCSEARLPFLTVYNRRHI